MPRLSDIELDQAWESIEKGMTKLKRVVEGEEPEFNSEEYMNLYTTIHNLYQLYDNYKQTIVDYVNSTVLPPLREKDDEPTLKELVKRWSNHKVMIKRLGHFFEVLDRRYVNRRSVPSLQEVGLSSFRDMVYLEISGKAKDAVIALIDVEREGGEIDRELLKNLVDMYVEIDVTLIQSKECLRKEKDRVSHSLHPSSELKLLEKVQNQLSVYENQLLKK